jgi:hypothetical protein
VASILRQGDIGLPAEELMLQGLGFFPAVGFGGPEECGVWLQLVWGRFTGGEEGVAAGAGCVPEFVFHGVGG